MGLVYVYFISPYENIVVEDLPGLRKLVNDHEEGFKQLAVKLNCCYFHAIGHDPSLAHGLPGYVFAGADDQQFDRSAITLTGAIRQAIKPKGKELMWELSLLKLAGQQQCLLCGECFKVTVDSVANYLNGRIMGVLEENYPELVCKLTEGDGIPVVIEDGSPANFQMVKYYLIDFEMKLVPLAELLRLKMLPDRSAAETEKLETMHDDMESFRKALGRVLELVREDSGEARKINISAAGQQPGGKRVNMFDFITGAMEEHLAYE